MAKVQRIVISGTVRIAGVVYGSQELEPFHGQTVEIEIPEGPFPQELTARAGGRVVVVRPDAEQTARVQELRFQRRMAQLGLPGERRREATPGASPNRSPRHLSSLLISVLVALVSVVNLVCVFVDMASPALDFSAWTSTVNIWALIALVLIQMGTIKELKNVSKESRSSRDMR